MTVSDLIEELISAGWSVTFPAFVAARSYSVVIRKGSLEHKAGWISERSLVDALTELFDMAKDTDGSKSEGDGC